MRAHHILHSYESVNRYNNVKHQFHFIRFFFNLKDYVLGVFRLYAREVYEYQFLRGKITIPEARFYPLNFKKGKKIW